MTKKETYELLLEQMKSLIVPGIPKEGNIANLLAQMKEELGLFWCGLYMKQENNTLGLGVFQGLPACTVIQWGKGVCGTAAAKAETQIVEDVSQFPEYIACHAETRSEIVIPGFIDDEVRFVLDVDSNEKGYFDETDKVYLEKATRIIANILNES